MRTIWTAVALVGASLIIGGSVFGAAAMADDAGVGEPKTITVTSTASVGSEPDEAIVTIGVSTQDPDSATALGRNGEQVDQVIAALENAGVAEADISTTRLNLARRTLHRRTPQETRVFVVDSSLEVTIHDLNAVGGAIQAAVDAGANQVRGVRFEVSDPSSARVDALDQAVQGARSKADAIAAAAGTSVTGVVLVVEQGAEGPPYPSARHAYYAVDEASARVLAPDTIDTSVTVTVTWSIA